MNHCQCLQGWWGDSCSVSAVTCFGIISNDSNVCSGHGICYTNNNCTCSNGWTGTNCDITYCNGLLSNHSLVCNGKGVCKNLESCECSNGWYGSNCNITQCGTKLSNESLACNGHGKCIDIDTCNCDPKWLGSNCNVTSCFSILSNLSSVCGGHGKCTSPDFCSCSPGFFNSNCSVSSCFGYLSNDEMVCQNHGECVSVDTCSCKADWFGKNCNITSCFGILANSSNVCSGHGICQTTNQCSCNANYFTSSCSVFCEPSITCNGNGNCSRINGSCKCNSDPKLGYWDSLSNCLSCQSDYYGDMCLTSYSKNALLSDDGKQILFSLFAPYTFNHSSIICSVLISQNDVNKLGSPSKCIWVNKESGEFSIELGSLNSIKIGDIININMNVFNKVQSTLFAPLTILAPLQPVKPVAVISTITKAFSSCDEINIVGSSSYDSFYSNLEFRWSIISSPLTISQLSKILYNNSILIIDSSAPSGNYTIQLKVSNKFNTESEPVYYTFTKESITVPQIKIVDADDINVQVNQVPIYVKQYISFTACALNESLPLSLISINWDQLEGPLTDYTVLPNNDLIINSFSDQTAKKYVFQTTLTFLNRTTTNTKITINTLEPDFGIILYQSNVNSSHVTINVESDPSEILSTLSTASWSWSCKNVDLVTNCEQSVLDQLVYHGSIRSSSFALVRGNSNIIQLKLQIKNAIANIAITFPQDQTIPIINLISVSPQKTLVTTNDKLSLQLIINVNGQVDSIDSLIKREWKLNDQPLNLTSALVSPIDPSKSNFVSISISEIPEGSSNTLSCTVTSISSKLSTTFSYSFNVAFNPKPCYCSISPSRGYALETLFSINCPNCLTQDTSLQIAFLDSKTGLRIPLIDGIATKISIQLPYTGSTSLPLYFIVKNTQTGAQVETSIIQTTLIPKAISVSEVKKKKSAWDAFYKTLATGDPRKTVFDYITTTVYGMTIALTGRRSTLNSDLCMNNGTFNSYSKQCICPDGFKKSDCSMTLNEWNEATNSRWLTAQLIFEEFELRNEFEPQSEKKLSSQISAMYHLLELYDEITSAQFVRAFDIFQKQIRDAQKIPYLTISKTLSNAMSATLSLLERSKLSIDGSITQDFDEQLTECLSGIASIRFRNQIIGTLDDFDTFLIKLTSEKLYPTDTSNQMIGEQVLLPNMMTKYLKNVDLRKVVNLRVWKRMVESTIKETSSTIGDSSQKTSTIRIADNILSLEISNQQLSIPKDEKIITYYFQFHKMVNNSFVTEATMNKNTTSHVVGRNYHHRN